MQVEPQALQELGISSALLTPSRSNGFLTMLQRMRKLARQLHAPLPEFPSLLISADSTTPQGAFARAQNQYLQPDPPTVDRLVEVSSCFRGQGQFRLRVKAQYGRHEKEADEQDCCRCCKPAWLTCNMFRA